MDIRNIGWIVTLAACSTMSCGDAVPPPAEGAVSISLYNSPTGACSSYSLGLMGGDNPPDSTNTGDLLADGHDGAIVTCKVKGDETYDVSAKISSGTRRFSISGTLNADGAGTATVSLWHAIEAESIADTACSIELGNGKYAVEPGAIWARVSCSNLTPALSTNVSCAATGTIVFKSCND